MLKSAIGKDYGNILSEKCDITTPEKFLTTSCHEICFKLNISMTTYNDLKNRVISKFSQFTSLMTVEDLLNQNLLNSKSNSISTGIRGLDSILNGGFLNGSVTEICGMQASGKSNLCMHIALRILVNSYVSNNKNSSFSRVIYIDTEGKFDVNHFGSILKSCYNISSEEEKMQILSHFHLERPYDLDAFVQLKERLCDEQWLVHDNVELIVIDSITALINHLGGRGKSIEDENIVVQNIQALRKTANSCDFSILCTNQGRVLTSYTGTHFLTPTSTSMHDSGNSDNTSSNNSIVHNPRLMIASAFVNSFQINQTFNSDSNPTTSSSCYDINEGSTYSIPVTSIVWHYCVDTQLVLAVGELNMTERIESIQPTGLISSLPAADNTLENMMRTKTLFSIGRIRIQNSKQCSITQSEQLDSYFYLCDRGLFELL